MPPLHSQTYPLTLEQADKLRHVLRDRGFTFLDKQYTLYAASKEKLNIAVYEKGPKVLLQGRGLEDFITFVMEPEILGEARLGYEEIHEPELFSPHFGVDESGKGDLFGPLVIAGVYVDGDLASQLRDAGVKDSKGIGTDKKIRELADVIRKSGAPFEIVVMHAFCRRRFWKKGGKSNSISGRKPKVTTPLPQPRFSRAKASSTGWTSMEENSASRFPKAFQPR